MEEIKVVDSFLSKKEEDISSLRRTLSIPENGGSYLSYVKSKSTSIATTTSNFEHPESTRIRQAWERETKDSSTISSVTSSGAPSETQQSSVMPANSELTEYELPAVVRSGGLVDSPVVPLLDNYTELDEDEGGAYIPSQLKARTEGDCVPSESPSKRSLQSQLDDLADELERECATELGPSQNQFSCIRVENPYTDGERDDEEVEYLDIVESEWSDDERESNADPDHSKEQQDVFDRYLRGVEGDSVEQQRFIEEVPQKMLDVLHAMKANSERGGPNEASSVHNAVAVGTKEISDVFEFQTCEVAQE
jgi:hypothetical protein